MASQRFAEEPGTFQNRLEGATIGLPLGALPPPGLYTGLETAYLGISLTPRATSRQLCHGQRRTTGLPAIAQAVPLLYVPGWNFLGATYSMSVVEAFYEFELAMARKSGLDNAVIAIVGGGFVFANPTFNPINLSWNLGNGWFVSVGFNFMAPDRQQLSAYLLATWTRTRITGRLSRPSRSAISPTTGCCRRTSSTTSTPIGRRCCVRRGFAAYQNGDLFYGDLTALYKFGKWEVGPVGYFEVQTTSDRGYRRLRGRKLPPRLRATAAIIRTSLSAASIGYDFGPVDLQVWVTDIVEAQNSPAGVGSLWVWTRMGFRLWAPEAAKPLVAKN